MHQILETPTTFSHLTLANLMRDNLAPANLKPTNLKSTNLEPTTLAPVASLGADCSSFFSLHKTPFTFTPPKKNIFQHKSYLHVKNTLLYGVTSGERILKVTGETGSGKTLLIDDVLTSIDENYYAIRILNAEITAKELLYQIIDEFGHPYPADSTIEQLLRLLRYTLHEHYTQTDAKLLIWIDDAHCLSNETLLVIEKISSWSTPSRSLLQIIVSGNNELNDILEHTILASLKNNIRFSDNLKNISKEEIPNYIKACIQANKRHEEPQFTPKALNLIYTYSNGNPSIINKIAYKSLLLAFGKGLRIITHKFVKIAFQDERQSKKQAWPYFFKIAVIAGISINTMLATAFFGGFL